MRFGKMVRCILLLATGVGVVSTATGSETAIHPRGGVPGPTALAGRARSGAVGGGSASNCSLIFDNLLVTDRFAYAFDSVRKVSYVFTRRGGIVGDSIICHEIDADLHVTTKVLPLPLADTWFAVDLDRDGQLELVTQRGSPPFVDGLLEIYSAPDWRLRARFVFPGMTVGMCPTPVNADADSFLEIFATPSGFGPAKAVLIDYDPARDTFTVVTDVAAPPETFGEPAVGDFDQDGRVEFVVGNHWGYGLFEYDGRTLSYIGNVIQNSPALNQSAVACRPKPDGVLYALIASSDHYGTYHAWLLRPVADNSFDVVWSQEEPGGGEGSHNVYAADIDCDGLDELFLNIQATLSEPSRVWEWDEATGDFVPGCEWETSIYGKFVQMQMTDFDQDGNREWSTIPSYSVFRTFEDSRCHPCCPLQGDIDGSNFIDLTDVLRVIGIAFTNGTDVQDSSCARTRGDVNNNGVVDVNDVIYIIKTVFTHGPNPVNPCAP